LVPAKSDEFNDATCLADASHELDTIFAEQQRVFASRTTREPSSKTRLSPVFTRIQDGGRIRTSPALVFSPPYKF
jgi:hypothetical protein